MSTRGESLTPRAESVAAQEDYGTHRSSHRVNRAHDRRLTVAVLMLPLGAVMFGWMAWGASPWSSDGTGGSLAGMAVSASAGLIFLALTLGLAIPLLLSLFRVKGAWVHVFERGAIAERPRGRLYAWPFARATIRYVYWQESWDGQWRDRPQLWVTFRDGESICFDGLNSQDRAALDTVARAFGIDGDPESIGALHPASAPTPF